MANVSDCILLDFRQIHDDRGSLTPVESGKDIPFAIRRVFYLYDVPAGVEREGHAYKTLQQVLIAISGRCVVHLDDGMNRREVTLRHSHVGLYIPPKIWRRIDGFASGSMCLTLASDYYDEGDYYREYAAFQRATSVQTLG